MYNTLCQLLRAIVNCVSEKTSPFYICDNLIRYHSNLPILACVSTKNWQNWMTSDQVITNRERVTFFLRHSVDDLK